jgi:cleavage stimulation factor subunit 2
MTIARPQQQPPAQQQQAMPEENPYGPEPEAGKAPEAIARTVASMPPEKMFELMRSMKDTVNNNPQMARQLLIENPQLSYALLQVPLFNLIQFTFSSSNQAQVVMRVVDPKVAYSMLHREQAQPLVPQQQPPPQMGGMTGPPPSVVPPFQQGPPPQFSVPPPQMTQQPPQSQFSMPPPGVVPGPGGPQFHHNFPPPGMGMPPPRQPQPPPQHFGGQPPQQQHPTPMVQQMAPQQVSLTFLFLNEMSQISLNRCHNNSLWSPLKATTVWTKNNKRRCWFV